MASLTIAGAGVIPVDGGTVYVDRNGRSGAALDIGVPVYRDAVNGQYKLALNDSAVHAAAVGVTLNKTLGAGQPVQIGYGLIDYTGTTTIAPAATYAVGATGGVICDNADVTTGKFKTVIAIGVTANRLNVLPFPSGVAVP